MAKGYTRKITRKQALSYERLTPNGIGVTAIAAVNGRRRKKKPARKNASRVKSVWRAITRGAAPTRRRAKRPLSRARYTKVGARSELRHLKSQKRFTPAELKSLGRGGRVKRGGSTYYSPYLSGFARQRGGRGLSPNRAEAPTCPPAATANRRRKKKGKGADYQRRYRQTRAILEAPVKRRGSRRRIAGMPVIPITEEHEWTPHVVRGRRRRRASTKETAMKRRAKKRRTPAQRAAFKRMIAGLKAYKRKKATGGGRKKARRRGRRSYAANRKLTKAERRVAGRKAARTRKRKKAVRSAAAKKAARTRRRRGGRKVRRNARRRAPTATYVKNRKGRRASFPRVTASVGKRKVKTYLYKTKRGGVKHIPVYALAGMRSRKAMGAALQKGGKTADRIRRRVAAIRRQRERASRRVMLHGDIFTPNRGTSVPFSTWSKSMRPNRRKRKSTSRSSKRSRAAKKAARTRKLNRAIRVRAGKKAARTRRRRKGGGRRKKKYAANRRGLALVNRKRRRSSKKAPRRRRRRRVAAAAPVKRRRRRSSGRRKRYAANRRRRSYASLPAKGPFYANRRRRSRRRYHANAFKAKDFMKQFTGALKLGLAVSIGFIGHRALSKVLANGLRSSGVGNSLGTWTDTVAQLIVAGGGMIGLAALGEKRKPNERAAIGQVNAGVFGSFVHALVTMLVRQAAPQYTEYLSGYPDAQGRAFSEYIATSGFGSPMLSQAAAGFGQHPMLSQAAAGTGEYIATSGFGSPMLSQAAAGIGEYIATGVSGIGDYEMVSGTGSAFGVEDDGIRPNLDSAEHALNIAEAAAGVGIGDLPTSSQQYPMMVAKPISDVPTGARAGSFAGQNGIFG